MTVYGRLDLRLIIYHPDAQSKQLEVPKLKACFAIEDLLMSIAMIDFHLKEETELATDFASFVRHCA